MKHKLEQYNQAYKKAIGQILVKTFAGVFPLVVVDVLLDPSYKTGRVWLSTTPEILKEVEAKRIDIQKQLQTLIKSRYTPRLEFLLDDDYLNRLDSLYQKLDQPTEQ